MLLSEQFEAEYKLTRNLEILTDKLQQTYRELESEKQKTDQLLYSVLPQSVANELRHQRPVNPKRYDYVTLMFSGIVGFSQYCAKNTSAEGAMKIVKMLNELYTIFDSLTDSKSNSNVYKVNTLFTPPPLNRDLLLRHSFSLRTNNYRELHANPSVHFGPCGEGGQTSGGN